MEIYTPRLHHHSFTTRVQKESTPCYTVAHGIRGIATSHIAATDMLVSVVEGGGNKIIHCCAVGCDEHRQ